MNINSQEWWGNEFENEWEKGIDGKLQTAYYASLFISALSQNQIFLKDFQSASSILDYGCALGQATNILSSINQNITGYDFSEVAIERAKELFPHLNFIDTLDGYIYDTIYCSNTLEHFKDPFEMLENMSKIASNYIYILVPYNQIPLPYFHHFTFNSDTFLDEQFNGFRCIQHFIINADSLYLDGGKQILYVFKNMSK